MLEWVQCPVSRDHLPQLVKVASNAEKAKLDPQKEAIKTEETDEPVLTAHLRGRWWIPVDPAASGGSQQRTHPKQRRGNCSIRSTKKNRKSS